MVAVVDVVVVAFVVVVRLLLSLMLLLDVSLPVVVVVVVVRWLSSSMLSMCRSPWLLSLLGCYRRCCRC